MFQSPLTIVLTIALTVIAIVFYTLRVSPFKAVFHLMQDLIKNKVVFFHFAAMMAILMFNKIELSIEREMIKQTDFTPMIHAFEGDFVAMFQRYLENDILTYITTFFYVIVFTALLIASLLIYNYGKDYTSFYALFYGVMMNYMIAIPFYLFFPVYEAWYYHPDIRFLIPDVYPGFETEYRMLSGLDNCFPSLHTSLSLTMAFIAMRSNFRVFGRITMFSAIVIIFSIFYLGIHWLSDMTAGALVAMFITTMAIRLAENPATAMAAVSTEVGKKR